MLQESVYSVKVLKQIPEDRFIKLRQECFAEMEKPAKDLFSSLFFFFCFACAIPNSITVSHRTHTKKYVVLASHGVVILDTISCCSSAYIGRYYSTMLCEQLSSS